MGPVLVTPTIYCRSIYSAIIEGHLGQGGFEAGVAKLGSRLVDAIAGPAPRGS